MTTTSLTVWVPCDCTEVHSIAGPVHTPVITSWSPIVLLPYEPTRETTERAGVNDEDTISLTAGESALLRENGGSNVLWITVDEDTVVQVRMSPDLACYIDVPFIYGCCVKDPHMERNPICRPYDKELLRDIRECMQRADAGNDREQLGIANKIWTLGLIYDEFLHFAMWNDDIDILHCALRKNVRWDTLMADLKDDDTARIQVKVPMNDERKRPAYLWEARLENVPDGYEPQSRWITVFDFFAKHADVAPRCWEMVQTKFGLQ